jgi:hypothetical protein
MKFLTKILLILLLTSISSIVYAEDVLIIHQGYSNSHIKWKNRLEDAGHTVTSVNMTSASFPSSTTSYEQIYDVRHGAGGTHLLTSAIETAYKALLARGGTLYLQTENPGCCNVRNQNIVDFIEDELGGGTITYHTSSYSSNSITVHNSNESWLSGFSGTVTFSAGGILTAVGNGTWFAKDGSGNIVGVVWYGSDLSSSYSGKVIVITDINYNSHSAYYTDNNKNWMNAMRTMLASTYNTAVSRSSSQTTTLNTAIAATSGSDGNLVYIEQIGNNSTIDIHQDGTDNFIVDVDWSGPAILNGANQDLDVDQLTSDNGLALGMIGNNIEVTVAQGTIGTNGGHKAIIDIDAASNIVGLTQYDGGTLSQHFAFIDVDGASNNIQVTQRDNGQKILFMDVDIISGDIDIMQRDTGTHYLELNLTGSAAHEATITQQGTGDHAARVTLGGGYAIDFDLLQQGSSDQSYELNSTCSNALGCTVNVTQGE